MRVYYYIPHSITRCIRVYYTIYCAVYRIDEPLCGDVYCAYKAISDLTELEVHTHVNIL